ncbi:hypothetical protein MMC19_005610 [Ptychographa xylographoides]|nr:hypothetical protein [Ptychographa xylographoides]
MGTIPAPPGIIPDFNNPPRDNSPLVLTIVFMTLAIIAVVMRLFTRIVLLRSFGWDDATCTIAMVFGIAFAVSNFALVSIGLGVDLWNIPFGQFDLIAWARWLYVQDLVYSLVMGFIKISILLLYFRLFQVHGAIKWIVWSSIIYVALYTIVGDLVTIFACKPLNTLWDGLQYGKCLNTSAVGIALATLQISADVIILAIPVPIVLGLQAPLKQRLAVMSIFGAGIFVTAASCARLAYLVQALGDPTAELYATTSVLNFGNWSIIEMYLAIVISCMSSFRAFLSKGPPWVRSVSTRRSRISDSMETRERQYHPQKRPLKKASTSGESAETGGSSDPYQTTHSFEYKFGPEDQGLEQPSFPRANKRDSEAFV